MFVLTEEGTKVIRGRKTLYVMSFAYKRKLLIGGIPNV
jgi:hypothetical protein